MPANVAVMLAAQTHAHHLGDDVSIDVVVVSMLCSLPVCGFVYLAVCPSVCLSVFVYAMPKLSLEKFQTVT